MASLRETLTRHHATLGLVGQLGQSSFTWQAQRGAQNALRHTDQDKTAGLGPNHGCEGWHVSFQFFSLRVGVLGRESSQYQLQQASFSDLIFCVACHTLAAG